MKINRFTLIIVVIISFLVTPFTSRIYLQIFGPLDSGWWGPSNLEYFLSFLINLVFWGSFFSWYLVNKWKIWVYYTLPIPLFDSIIGARDDLIITTGLAVAGFILAQLILLINKKIFNSGKIEQPVVTEQTPAAATQVNFSGTIRIILVIYLSIEYFTRILFGFYTPERLIIIFAIKLISLAVIIFALYYAVKKDVKCYKYIIIYVALNIILQFFNSFDLAAFVIYIILVVFAIFKLNIIKGFNNIKYNSDIDQVIIVIFILSILFRIPIFLLVILSFADLFSSLFIH